MFFQAENHWDHRKLSRVYTLGFPHTKPPKQSSHEEPMGDLCSRLLSSTSYLLYHHFFKKISANDAIKHVNGFWMYSQMSMDVLNLHQPFFFWISSPTRGSTVAEPLRLPGTFETSKSAAQTSLGAGSTGIGQFYEIPNWVRKKNRWKTNLLPW